MTYLYSLISRMMINLRRKYQLLWRLWLSSLLSAWFIKTQVWRDKKSHVVTMLTGCDEHQCHCMFVFLLPLSLLNFILSCFHELSPPACSFFFLFPCGFHLLVCAQAFLAHITCSSLTRIAFPYHPPHLDSYWLLLALTAMSSRNRRNKPSWVPQFHLLFYYLCTYTYLQSPHSSVAGSPSPVHTRYSCIAFLLTWRSDPLS